MSPDEVLNQLRDIYLPEPISIWPPALAWFILAGLLIFLAFLAAWFLYQNKRKMRAKRSALKRLQALKAAYAKHGDAAWAAQQLSILLHRVALAYYPRAQVAGLTADAWLAFLEAQHVPATKNTALSFCSPVGRLLLTAPYTEQVVDDLNPLFELAAHWIKSRGKT